MPVQAALARRLQVPFWSALRHSSSQEVPCSGWAGQTTKHGSWGSCLLGEQRARLEIEVLGACLSWMHLQQCPFSCCCLASHAGCRLLRRSWQAIVYSAALCVCLGLGLCDCHLSNLKTKQDVWSPVCLVWPVYKHCVCVVGCTRCKAHGRTDSEHLCSGSSLTFSSFTYWWTLRGNNSMEMPFLHCLRVVCHFISWWLLPIRWPRVW